MKMRKILWSLCVLGMLLSPALAANTAPSQEDTLRLTLGRALEIALSDNPTVLIAEMGIERQEYVRKETMGALMPNLSLSGGYNRSVIKSTVDLGGGQTFSFEPTNVISGAAALSLPIFAPSVYSTLKLNDEQMRAAVETARASRITLRGEVLKAYYNVLMASESLAVLEANAETIAETVAQTQSLFDAELASEYDLITAQVQLSNFEPQILQAENSIHIAEQLLKMYLYLPVELPITLEESLADFSHHAELQEFLSDDLSQNSDLRQLAIQERLLEQQLNVAQSGRMPTLSAVGNFQVQHRNKVSFGSSMGGSSSAATTSAATKALSNPNLMSAESSGTALPSAVETWETQTPMTVGLQLSVPIFSGWSRTNREKQIKNDIEQIQLQQDYLLESTQVQARTAISNLLTAQSQMGANRVTIEQADKGYQIARTRYFAGMGTILEVNTAALSLTQAQLNYTQSLYNLLAARADYEVILGQAFTPEELPAEQ